MNWWLLLVIWVICYWILDVLWVSIIKKVFQERLQKLLKKNVDRLAALVVWILMSWWLFIFVVSSPVVRDVSDAFSMWMIFGLIVYGVYETTNQALLKKRQWNIVLVDTCRWMLLCWVMSVFLRYLTQQFWITF